MELKLERVDKQVGAIPHLYPLDMALQSNAVTVLLGATQAGKTSLMRLMARMDMMASCGAIFVETMKNVSRFLRRAAWWLPCSLACAKPSVRIVERNSGRSDHSSFAKANILALHLYTGYHADYHKSTDVADKIDFEGLNRVIDFAEDIVRVGRKPGARK